MPNTLVYIAAAVSAVTALISLVVLPMLAYIVRRGDHANDRRDERLSSLERKDTVHDVEITRIQGELRMINLVYGEVRDMRDKMLTRDEFERRITVLERAVLGRDPDGA